MRSAQSRLGVVTSLGAMRRSAGVCVEALPVSLSAIKLGSVAAAGLLSAVLMRGLFAASRRKAAAASVTRSLPAPGSPAGAVGSYLLSEAAVTLLLPLLRRYMLGEGPAAPAAPGAAAIEAKPAARGLLRRLFSSAR